MTKPIEFTITELDLIMEGLNLKDAELNRQLDTDIVKSELFYRPSIINELSVLSVIKRKIFHHLIGN